MANLALKNVSKIYSNNVRAVSHVNLEVADGEFVVLVGPSGCGKSTILRMIAGLETVTAGEIMLNGRSIIGLPPATRDIAMVFQNYALYPHMTVFKNMAFGLMMRKIPKPEIEQRVRDVAETLELRDLLDRKPKALSGGQRQRVALGRAIVRQPELFLFDEPLSNLDAKLRVAMRGELIKLHKRLHATMVYVTHDQMEAMSMGNRLIVLKNGRLQQAGAPLEIYNRPANRFVAGFIGSPPMNFISCSIMEDGADGVFLTAGPLRIPLSEHLRRVLFGADATPRQIIVGIRPEDISEERFQTSRESACIVPVQVEFMETLGSEILATCRLGQQEIIARLSPKTGIRADTVADLVFDTESIKFFHPETEKTLA